MKQAGGVEDDWSACRLLPGDEAGKRGAEGKHGDERDRTKMQAGIRHG
jgi:hypothetical protein